VQEFVMPIEQREENVDRAVEIVLALASAVEGPVFANFMGVPLVGIPDQNDRYTRECWQKLYDQYIATPQQQVQDAPEPEPVKRWYHTVWGKLLIGIPAAVLVVLVIIGASAVYDVWEGPDSLVTYDWRDASYTINVTAMKDKIGCAPVELLNFSETSVGGPNGNITEKFVPFCQSPFSFYFNSTPHNPVPDQN
jgi:hypothetical protein